MSNLLNKNQFYAEQYLIKMKRNIERILKSKSITITELQFLNRELIGLNKTLTGRSLIW